MADDPTEEFWQWLAARKAAIEKEMENANTHNRMLLKTARAELDWVMAAYERIVMKRA
jgi:cell division protein FtsB